MIINELIAVIESFAPFGNAEGFDNVGLIVGSKDAEISGILITLDMTDETIAEANELGFNTILTHHPAIFHPLKRITSDMTVFKAVRNNINVISAHTNLDRSLLGVNVALSNRIGLPNPMPLFSFNEEKLDYGYGCLSILDRPVSIKELSSVVKDTLGCGALRYFDSGRIIRNIAVIGGSGGSMLSEAKAAGADCLITGDIKHDVFYIAKDLGISLIDAGHYFTEAPVLESLANILEPHFNSGEVVVADSDKPPFITTF